MKKNSKMNFILILISIFGVLSYTNGAPQQSLCQFNETFNSYRPIQKTRQIIKKPTGLFKMLKKTKTITETYEEIEKHVSYRMVTKCCEGFQLNETSNECQPICKNGCPLNSVCIEPNRCQCHKEYISAYRTSDGSHYCEPICEFQCPENALCVTPNKCECMHGYIFKDNKYCEPQCLENCAAIGMVCTSPNVCQDLSVETTTMESITSSIESVVESNCSEGFVFYQGICRSKLFASNEADCRIKPCAANSTCQDNGSCTCLDGFKEYNPSNQLYDMVCLTLDQYEKQLLLDTENAVKSKNINETDFEEDDDDLDWMALIIVIVGVACTITALFGLVWKIRLAQKGKAIQKNSKSKKYVI